MVPKKSYWYQKFIGYNRTVLDNIGQYLKEFREEGVIIGPSRTYLDCKLVEVSTVVRNATILSYSL